MLIEDNEMNRQVVRDMLAVAGLQIDEASNGPEGLRMLDQKRHDVLLVDLRMPGMDGFDVIQKVRRRRDELSTMAIVVISGDDGLHLRSDCLRAGADDLIAKPVSMQDLFDSIGAVLAKRALLGGLIC
ncbi:response regulator [Sphingomonas qilianensis]|uniref:Response regulator n=1 Tax=Sphingomonas qilianensis TaxID=1736690 RepID=A0ABU9XR20_9SPHN